MKLWEIIVGLVIAALLAALLYGVYDLRSTTTNIKDQVVILTGTLQKKFPKDNIPNVVAQQFGLNETDRAGTVYMSPQELPVSAKVKLNSQGYEAISLAMSPEEKAAISGVNAYPGHAYILMKRDNELTNKKH